MELIRDDVDYEAYMAEPEAKQKVRPASAWTDELIRMFAMPDHANGVLLPWRKTSEQFRLRDNELTLWPGINGHGKSLVLGQIMLGAMAQGQKVLVASMEMKPKATMQRMCRQGLGIGHPSPTEVREFSNWTDDRLWIFDHLGAVSWQKLLGVLRYCHVELGIQQFVVDSLMRCGIADDDYNGQKAFMDALCTFRMDYPVHVHLVLHSRKLADEMALPGKFDVKGSSSLTDMADNVVTVWRNKRKEEAQQKSSYLRNDKDDQAMKGPDCLLVVDKQRHWEWEGKIALWYLSGCMQFAQAENETASYMLELYA